MVTITWRRSVPKKGLLPSVNYKKLKARQSFLHSYEIKNLSEAPRYVANWWLMLQFLETNFCHDDVAKGIASYYTRVSGISLQIFNSCMLLLIVVGSSLFPSHTLYRYILIFFLFFFAFRVDGAGLSTPVFKYEKKCEKATPNVGQRIEPPQYL